MARNHEKQYGKLNRLLLWKEKEEYEKKHPTRPRLDVLDTPEEIKKWIPSIKADLEFFLKKSQVTCYSDQHIEECKTKVNNLEKEYKSFVRKIAKLTPGKLDAAPWTKRPYKRKIDGFTDEQCSKKEFVPIPTPILDKVKEPLTESINTLIALPNLPLMDEPLVFAFEKETQSHESNSNPNDFKNIKNYIDNNCNSEISTVKNLCETKNYVQQKIIVPNLVNYDYSSDSDS